MVLKYGPGRKISNFYFLVVFRGLQRLILGTCTSSILVSQYESGNYLFSVENS
jgi:hypothetical protein